MKTKELRDLSQEQLLQKLKEIDLELDEFYKKTAERIEKKSAKKFLKRDRARILTLLNEKLLNIR